LTQVHPISGVRLTGFPSLSAGIWLRSSMVTGCTMLQQQQELQRRAPELRSGNKAAPMDEICNPFL